MFKAIKKWFINQMGGLYEEIMIIKSQQLSLEETLQDHHAEVMARLDDIDNSFEELLAEKELKLKRKGKQKL